MNFGGFQACLRVPLDNCQTTFECSVLVSKSSRISTGWALPHVCFVCVCLFCCWWRPCVGGKKGLVLYVGGSPLGPAWRGLSQKRGRGESCERTSGIFSIRLNDGIRIVWFVEWEWDCIWWGVAVCHEEWTFAGRKCWAIGVEWRKLGVATWESHRMWRTCSREGRSWANIIWGKNKTFSHFSFHRLSKN